MKRVVFIFLLLIVVAQSSLIGQNDPADLRCIAVEDNDIILTWIPVPDLGGTFQGYQVFTSTNGSPYVPFGLRITNRLQNTYPITGINFPRPGINSLKFYIQTQYAGGINVSSDTLQAMELKLAKHSGNSAGVLTWNLMRPTALPTWDNKYDIDRSIRVVQTPALPYNWTKSFAEPAYSSTTFSDTIVRCNSRVDYRVELPDASGCISKSNITGDILADLTGPTTMTYSSITVGKGALKGTELNWALHSDGSVVKYLLVHQDVSGIEVPIDTVSSITTKYQDLNSSRDPGKGRQCYLITTIDSCGNSQGATERHCTMFLSSTLDNCEGEITLKWTPYEGWASVDSYKVYMSSSSDTIYRQIGIVSGTDSTFVRGNLSSLESYNFYVEALDASGLLFSHSNELENISFQMAGATKFAHVRSASILSQNEVELRLLVDRKSPIKHLNVYRGLSRSGPFKKVKREEPPLSVLDTFFTISDATGKPYQFPYVYFIEVIDTCNMPVIQSNKFRTIYLSGTSDKNQMKSDITWLNNVAVDSTAVEEDHYLVYRYINNKRSRLPIRIRNVDANFFQDDLQDFVHQGDRFCYDVKLVQYNSKTFDYTDTSSSNTICFEHEADVFIPNTFTPNDDGINETWRPITSYVVPVQNYHLMIFNRFGKLVFETTDPLEGWDGTEEDTEAAVGQYAYRYFIKTVHGSTVEKKGNFSLVR